jgi:hypothetical protein
MRIRGYGFVLAALGVAAMSLVGGECQTAPADTPKDAKQARVGGQREPRVLHVTGSKTLTVPIFPWMGPPQIDDNGDLFFQVISGSDVIEIFELTQPDESGSRMFNVTPELAKKYDQVEFAASPSGTVYVLAVSAANEFHILRLESDGDIKDGRLELPEGAAATGLGVFANDTVLVVGHYSAEAPQALAGKSYAALFDANGKLLADLANRLPPADPKARPDEFNEFSLRPSSDGNLYMLDGDWVVVISPGGEIVRRLKLHKPAPEYDSVGLGVSGGKLCVELSTVGPGRPVSPKFLVLNSSTGKEYGYFAPPDHLGASWVTCTKDGGFVFIGSDKDSLKILTLN